MASKNDLGVIYVFLLNSRKNCSAFASTDACTNGNNSTKLCVGISLTSDRYWEATLARASIGQGENQIKVQQLTNEGNILHLFLRASPTGDIAKITWKLFCN